MGLDMHLVKRTYIRKQDVTPTENLKTRINWENVNSIFVSEEVAYWRKANAIHAWFVENVQHGVDDCGEYNVDFDKLIELLGVCKTIKSESVLMNAEVISGTIFENGERKTITTPGAQIVNDQVAKNMLPTKEGFFFGSTNYDNYYMSQIDDTIKMLEEITSKDPEGDYTYTYCSSW
jgi:hypothetical protein